MENEYKSLEQQIIELWNSCNMKVIQERFHLDTWVITVNIANQKNKNINYEMIEQKIRELWKSRGMNVHSITFRKIKNAYIWTIIANRKSEEKK